MTDVAATAAANQPPPPPKTKTKKFLFLGGLVPNLPNTNKKILLRKKKKKKNPPPKNSHPPFFWGGGGGLLASSATVHFAERAAHRGRRGAFLGFWGLTILLGATFLACTAKEWYELIVRYGLTISRNMFGSTYFTLVGFHAAHVTVGLIILSIIFALAWQKKITPKNTVGIEVVSWYWHFVDAVWVVVFSLVYLIGV